MAPIAEEAAAPEQPGNAQSVEGEMPKGAWGGRRRRKGAATPQRLVDGLACGSEQAQGQSQHAGLQSQTAVAPVDQHAKQPDQALDQDVASTALTVAKVQGSLCISLIYWAQAVGMQLVKMD